MSDGSSCINVALRIRPLSNKEIETDTCIHVLPQEVGTGTLECASQFQSVKIGENESRHNFTFDHVLPQSTNQGEMYSTCANSLVKSCLEGYNATVLAYGQTGTGKTHTMIGDLGKGGTENKADGIIPRALKNIFNNLKHKLECQEASPLVSTASSTPSYEYQVKVQFLEVYGDIIKDLIVTQRGSKIQQRQYGPPRPVSRHLQRPQSIPSQPSPRHILNNPFCIKKTSTAHHRIQRSQSCHVKNPSHMSKTPPNDSMRQSLSLGKKRSRSLVRENSSLCTRKAPLFIRDGKDGEDAEVVGINQTKVQSAEEALKYLQQGMKMRRTAKTAMNVNSSRSHAIFTLVIQQTRRNVLTEGSNANVIPRGTVEMKTSKIHFVDLAGSERVTRTEVKGKRYVVSHTSVLILETMRLVQ